MLNFGNLPLILKSIWCAHFAIFHWTHVLPCWQRFWLSFGMLQHTGDPLDDMITPQRTHLSAASAPQMGQLGDASPSLTTTYHPLTTYYRPVYHLFFLQLTILTSHSCFNHFVQFCLDWDLFAFKSWIWSWCLWSSRKRVESDHCGNGDCSRAWYFLISHIGYYKGA